MKEPQPHKTLIRYTIHRHDVAIAPKKSREGVVQFILFLGIDFGVNLLQQRQRGLWKRFRAAPLSPAVLLGSRVVSAAIISFFVIVVNFLFARLIFGVRVEGSMAGFLSAQPSL